MDRETIKRTAKILIVDDEEAMVGQLERLLQQNGYKHVHSTTDPRQVP